MIPIIIVPGFMGSFLMAQSDRTHLWPPSPLSPNTSLQRLKLESDGSQRQADTAVASDVARWQTVISGGYQRTFDFFAQFGYVENTSIFGFPYDWRLDIRDTATALGATIQTARARTASSRVILLGHSMGGLVAAQYCLGVARSMADVERLFFLGAPMLGAPAALQQLRYAISAPFLSWIGLVPTNADLQWIVGTWPAAYALLPSRLFFNKNGGGFFKNGADVIATADATYDAVASPDFSSARAKTALDFHDALDAQRAQLRDASRMLLGSGSDTVKSIEENGTRVSTKMTTQGDSTVLDLGLADYIGAPRVMSFNGVSHRDLGWDTTVLNAVLDDLRSQIPFGSEVNLRSPSKAQFLSGNAANQGAAVTLAAAPVLDERWIIQKASGGTGGSVNFSKDTVLLAAKTGGFLSQGPNNTLVIRSTADDTSKWRILKKDQKRSEEIVRSFDEVLICTEAGKRASGDDQRHFLSSRLQVTKDNSNDTVWSLSQTR